MDECDFVIPLHRFHKLVRTTIESIGSFYNPRTIYIITPKKYVVEIEQVIENWNFKRVIVIEEDTFFIKNPINCLKIPSDYQKEVEKIHSFGGFGSKGYEYDWKEAEAKKNLLRTHTTAISS
jgi:phenylalanyl-tRNA synthetase alpha subunit